MRDADRYAYRVHWSAEDEAHVGTVDEFPSLSWVSDDATDAFAGIRALVADVLEDMEAAGEEPPAPENADHENPP